MADIGSVSTYAVFQSTLNNVNSVESELTNLQNQLSSGQKSQNFAGIADQAQQYIALGSQISQSTQYVTNNTLVSTRIGDTDSALTNIISSSQTLASLIQTRLTGTQGDNSTFSLQLNQQWQSIASSLNTTSGGDYIFSGTATNTPPVNPQNFPTVSATGAPDDSYYQGSNQDLTVRADNNTQITYNVRANATAFQQIAQGLALAKQGDANNDSDMLQQAYTMVENGLQGVTAIQSTVNANKVQVDNINTNQQSMQLYWKGVQENIGNTDLVSVSTQVAVDQGILQAAFQAFAKINSLSLASYLPAA